jgi:hypothetical protein
MATSNNTTKRTTAQAKRVHSTPRRIASKIQAKPSAVSRVQKSGFDLVRSKKRRGTSAKLRDFAKIDWRPWRRTPDMRPTELMPSREMTDRIGIGCRLAYGLMLRTRNQLIAMHGEVEHEHVDEMMGHLAETEEWLKATARMVEMAYLRVLASAAAAYTKGIKFKGVNDKPARRKAVA